MSFKVGDRVEVLTPADGAKPPTQPGLGTVTHRADMNGDIRVRLDGIEDSPSYYYSADQLRPLGTTEPTPKPSIQVGTQVRLTGEVVGYDSLAHPGRVEVKVANAWKATDHVWVSKNFLEVIRQPFKRGEVVYHIGAPESEPRTVVVDEKDGHVLLARHVHGTETLEWDATSFERRP